MTFYHRFAFIYQSNYCLFNSQNRFFITFLYHKNISFVWRRLYKITGYTGNGSSLFIFFIYLFYVFLTRSNSVLTDNYLVKKQQVRILNNSYNRILRNRHKFHVYYIVTEKDSFTRNMNSYVRSVGRDMRIQCRSRPNLCASKLLRAS